MNRYQRDQWVESFEGQLSILRPHLTQRLLSAFSNAAWHEHGRAGEDPIRVAKALSALMDRKGDTPGKKVGKPPARG